MTDTSKNILLSDVQGQGFLSIFNDLSSDKILDFFLRRKSILAKYTKEEKQKAIDLYINYCKRTTRVIKELGYPNKRHTLVSRYSEYEKNGKVKDDGRKEKKLSLEHGP